MTTDELNIAIRQTKTRLHVIEEEIERSARAENPVDTLNAARDTALHYLWYLIKTLDTMGGEL